MEVLRLNKVIMIEKGDPLNLWCPKLHWHNIENKKVLLSYANNLKLQMLISTHLVGQGY
jgi:hypothetical protein